MVTAGEEGFWSLMLVMLVLVGAFNVWQTPDQQILHVAAQ